MDSFENKLSRMQKTFSCEEPDRIPLFDLFWSEFVQKWRKEKGLGSDVDIYEYYDMDMYVVVPNTDPKIESYKLIERGSDYEIYKSGFGCTLKKADYSPMPQFLEFSVNSADEYEAFVLEDPHDERRWHEPSANVLGGAGNIELPSFHDQMQAVKGKFPTMGIVLEGMEKSWRIRGTEGVLMDMVLEKDKFVKFLKRLEEFEIQLGLKQIEMGVDFMMIGGDVGYDKGMFFSPDMWRDIFKPYLYNLCKALKDAKPDIKLIYHGCGNALAIYEDLIECGLDSYHSLEVKAGIDVVELKKKYKNRLSYIGNIDVRDILTGSKDGIRKDVLRKLNAAKGGGYIPASDHSVPDNVPVENYECFVDLVRKHGTYPLDLEEYDIPELGG